MKKYLFLIVLCLLLVVTFLYREELVVFYMEHFVRTDKTTILKEKNEYYKENDYSFVQNTTKFSPKNKQDILNIYYTVINSGIGSFTFYCPKEYKKCIDDVKFIANDRTTLSHINNFVHPYNSFENIATEYDNLGKISIQIQKTYSKQMQEEINNKITEIIDEIALDQEEDIEKKIKLIHDYIINHSKYDSARSDEQIVKYHSDIAYGTLLEGYGLCGGYTDSMALFLELLNIDNYKVSSDNHVWNAVKLDDSWYHLDLTWDDPVTTNDIDILEYNFFLITSEELNNIENTEHIFSTSVYKELVS